MDKSVKTHITALDVINAGACADGVFKWLIDNKIKRTLMPVIAVLKICSSEEKHYIRKSANLSGDGNGYGDGDGYGDGYGNGDGYGDGYGNGDGYGDGYGYGYGYGNGNGDGYGDGYGYGYGYGDGDGDGYGYGNGELESDNDKASRK